jgi:murein DD-endopeptidase MepM/ murein hydrolase activator NlpD
MARRSAAVAVALLLTVSGGCATASASREGAPLVANGSTTTSTSTTTTTLPPTTTTTLPPQPPAPTDRTVVDGHALPLAEVGGVTLVHPSQRVERVGFHQSSVLGAQELTPLDTAVSPTTLNTRARGTGDRTAADVVVQPGTTVLSPVTGTVVKAGGYRLYCAYDDETVVIAPDSHSGWLVVLFHVQGVLVTAGQRVTAGATPVATQAHQLPFRSQVDRLATVSPSWPHVHVEVDDTLIPDVASKGDSC